jgi:DNA-binding MarR family transcriptional regulator
MTRTGKKAVRETHQQKLARRFVEVMETIMERNIRIPQEHVSAMLELSPPEMRSLMWLSRRGMSVMSDFAQGIGVPLSTATRIINRLVKKGIVVRRRSDEDRRIVEIDLSTEAYEHRDRYVGKRLAAVSAVLAPLAREERDTVLNLLEKGLRLSAPGVDGASGGNS